jgi:hypothetical protein
MRFKKTFMVVFRPRAFQNRVLGQLAVTFPGAKLLRYRKPAAGEEGLIILQIPGTSRQILAYTPGFKGSRSRTLWWPWASADYIRCKIHGVPFEKKERLEDAIRLIKLGYVKFD